MTMAPVPIEKTQQIKDLHVQIIQKLQDSLDMGIRLGGLLTEVKEDLKHGEFGGWIKTNMPFTDRTARNYMKLYQNREKLKRKSVSDLKTAYKLLTTSKTEVDIIDFLMNDHCETLKHDGHDVDSFDEERLKNIRLSVVLQWIILKQEGDVEVIDSAMAWAQRELGGKVAVTNQWHSGFVTCTCPKCQGKIVDVRHFYEPNPVIAGSEQWQ